jgi:hypothetical protein
MEERPVKRRWAVTAALLLGAAGMMAVHLPVEAQVNRNTQRQGTIRRPAPKLYFKELQALVEKLAKAHDAKIVVDPALIVSRAPKEPSQGAAIEQALDELAAQIKSATWRRIYIHQGQMSALPAPERLAATVRALDLIEQGGVVLENPTNRRITYFVKNQPATPEFEQQLDAQQISKTPIYVLYNPSASADPNANKSPEERMLDLQRQQMEMMMQMDPDQMANAMSQGMQMWMNLDPQTRAQFFGNMMRAGMTMWQNMPAEQRQQMMQDMMNMSQQFFGPGGGGRPPRP